MVHIARTWIRTILSPLAGNRLLRKVFAYYFYRKWIVASETAFALRKNEKQLDDSYWVGMLRKYAHIVDKGLQRRDFSRGRGTRAYDQAKTALSHIQSHQTLEDPSVKWAVDKIRDYEEFQSGTLRTPKQNYAKTVCSYGQLLNVIKTRRSIRSYRNMAVSDELVHKITEVLDWCPTSCNRQTARVYAANNPKLVRECVQLHTGAACFTDIYAPLLLVFCADTRVYGPNEVGLPYIDVSLGVQNCTLVAHTLGISLTLLTWAQHMDWQERELRRLLGIPEYIQIIVSAVGGYPDRGVDVPARKKKELFLIQR